MKGRLGGSGGGARSVGRESMVGRYDGKSNPHGDSWLRAAGSRTSKAYSMDTTNDTANTPLTSPAFFCGLDVVPKAWSSRASAADHLEASFQRLGGNRGLDGE